jgi:DNA (cytosine-5)-methyltransferase 1
MPPDKNQLPVLLSFFTGGGFMDMGFENAGFDVQWTNEYDAQFAALYAAGITSWKNTKGVAGKFEISNGHSLKDIKSSAIIEEAFPNGKPAYFGMIGGPPCQDFSINGNLEGFKGDRGSLTDTYLDKVLDLQPAFFIMENVTGLLKVKKNAKHFMMLLKVMEDDYLIDYRVLNSLDYHVPQNRERVFVIGINKKAYDLSAIQPDLEGHWFTFPQGSGYSQTVDRLGWPLPNSFGEKISKAEQIPLELCVEQCLVAKDAEASTPNANEYFNLFGGDDKFKVIEEGETNRPSFKRLHRYKYSPTACYGNNEVHLHPYQHRRLSVRETLRIQSVDDSYVLPPKLPLSKKFKMIGNGVPVKMAQALASALAGFLQQLPHGRHLDEG